MNKAIVFTKPGRDTMTIKYPQEAARLEGETDEAFLQRIIEKEIPQELHASCVIVDIKDIPNTRENRNAWKVEGGKVLVDQAKVEG